MAFIQYTMQIIMGFLMICMISIMLPRAGVSADRIQEILTSKSVIDDPERSQRHSVKKKRCLKFEHVSFRYPGADEDVTRYPFYGKAGRDDSDYRKYRKRKIHAG